MNNNQDSTIVTERVDDIPLLLTHMMKMGIPNLLDTYFPTHNNWDGLSLGWTTTIWLTHILSQADHRLNQVQDWVAKHIKTLSKITDLTIRSSDFNNNRLAIILRYLNQDESWQEYENDQGRHLIRVYDLSTDLVRLDATTASSYIEPVEDSLLQLGLSHDYRPDLAQVKIMLASLDPLGLPLATQSVPGNEADDPLYEPAIKQVRSILNKEGVLYVGDCKMAASSIRARIQKALDYYLMPLPTTQVPIEVLDTYLTPVWEQTQTLEPIYRCNGKGEQILIAEGFELTEIVTGQTDFELISCSVRRLVVRSIKHAQAQEKALRERLEKAKTAITDLTRPRSGYKCITTLDLFSSAVNDIIKKYNVKSLLDIDAHEETIEHHRRRYRDKPERIQIERVLIVAVRNNEVALETAIKRLGWRVYATNGLTEKLSLHAAVLAYREAYLIERDFARLKGKPLSLTPMYLQRDDHIAGLIRLLTIGLRVLTLLEFMVRGKLAETKTDIVGIYAGNSKRKTKRPTAETLLRVFSYIDLVGIKGIDSISYHLTPLTALQQYILELLDFSPATYTQLLE